MAKADPAEPKPETPDETVTFWVGQLAAYDDEFKPWKDQCRKIIRRYRDERTSSGNGTPVGGDRFNALWSNIQVLMPAIYAKSPAPIVERRYRAKDPIGRVASMTLERACEVQMQIGRTHPAMKRAMLDYLLCGRGTLWERYEPTFGEAQDLGPGDAPGGDDDDDATQDTAGSTSLTESDDTPSVRPVTYEKAFTDYIAWDKFRHSPAAQWDETWWVSKDEMLTRKELRARFKDVDEASGKPIADLIPMRADARDKENDREKKRRNPRALVVEIWNKRDRKVIFIAPDWPNAPLEISDDELKLEGFFPCPEPIYATLTNDSLVPVPDYVEYQDQADELDSLSARIKALTDAVRANGVYDASIPELKRILQEGVDNRLIGVKNWVELVTKGGIAKAMDFVPLDMIVKALLTLHESFDKAKQKLDEITGISDIIRGQSSGVQKTATEQRIKGQFASLRIDDRKKEAARLARDTIAIKGEIIAEQFSTEILAEMTGMVEFIADEIKQEMPAPPSPMIGHNGGPPLDSQPVGTNGPQAAPPMNGVPTMGPQLPPPPDPQVLAQQRFEQGCKLLRNDKMRTFRIDIETDSTVETDRQAAKEAVTQMFMSVGQFLEKAVALGQAMPKAIPALGQSVLFAFRTFGAGRDVESLWEQAIDEMTQMAKNPPPRPPSPEQIKAEAEAAFLQQKGQLEADKHRMEMESAAQDAHFRQQEQGLKLRTLEEQHQQKMQHGAMEMERVRLELARLQTPTESDKGPSESISFKDLPPEGKAQMAAQAGITLTPETLKAHADDQAAQQKALKVAAPSKQASAPA